MNCATLIFFWFAFTYGIHILVFFLVTLSHSQRNKYFKHSFCKSCLEYGSTEHLMLLLLVLDDW